MLEECDGSDLNCGCDASFRRVQQLLLEVKEDDKRVLEQIEPKDIQGEIKQTDSYNLRMEMKIKQLNENVKPHLAELSSRKQTARISKVHKRRVDSEKDKVSFAKNWKTTTSGRNCMRIVSLGFDLCSSCVFL